MKILFKLTSLFITCLLVVFMLFSCAEKEFELQCEKAIKHCEQFGDSGACNSEYLEVCNER